MDSEAAVPLSECVERRRSGRRDFRRKDRTEYPAFSEDQRAVSRWHCREKDLECPVAKQGKIRYYDRQRI